MTVQLNGEDTRIDENTSIAQLLTQLELTGKRLAVEVNQQIVPRSDFASHILKADDRVEIVQAIGGGSL
ncbi:MAG TPA: sulfur carrier protein ThiS [Gammaproteobacteria bacterium]|nr:sulfur carrier protein ThiS [Gammaproteobacteria bacterium]